MSSIYQHKYYKYKSKYNKLKGGLDSNLSVNRTLGVNYVGGKIIKYILNSPHCIGYTNLQIVEDIPFQMNDVNSNVFSKLSGLERFFTNIFGQANVKNANVVIQINKGNEGIRIWEEILQPQLMDIFDGISNRTRIDTAPGSRTGNSFEEVVIVNFGYTQSKYFNYVPMETNFIFVNIGTFSLLNNVDGLQIGTICIPTATYDIAENKENKITYVASKTYHQSDMSLNIENVSKIELAGLSDDMNPINKDNYDLYQLLNLFNYHDENL